MKALAVKAEPYAVPVSYSRLSLYRRCPLAYKLRYIDHVGEEGRDPYLEFGRAAHTWLEHYLKGRGDVPVLFPPELAADWPALRERALQLLDGWSMLLDGLVGAEESLFYTWRDELSGRPVRLQVKFDALVIDDAWAWDIDWKTGFDIPNRRAMATDLQLMLGALVIMRNFPRVQVVQGMLVPLRYTHDPVSTDFTTTTINAFERQLRLEVSAFLSDQEYRPARNCDICPPAAHLSRLQPYRKARIQFQADKRVEVTLAPIRSAKQAERVAMGVRIAEALARAGRERLQPWTAEHGPVFLGEGAYGHWYQPETHVTDLERVVEVLREREVALGEVLSVNLQKAKKYLTGKKAIPALNALAVTVPKSKFDWRADGQKAMGRVEAAKADVRQMWNHDPSATLPARYVEDEQGGAILPLFKEET